MKKTLLPLLTLLLAGSAFASPASDLDVSKEVLLREIAAQAYDSGAQFPKARAAALEGELIRAVGALSSGAGKSGGYDAAGADIRAVNSVWALGEIGGADAERALLKALPAADRTMRLNIAAALDKISERAGGVRRDGDELEEAAGHMEPGDILFRKGYFGVLNSAIGAQTVGHVGVYAGQENGRPMVIEGWLPVRKVTLRVFVAAWPFYGNYTTSPEPTPAQRGAIVEYARAQLGKKYDMAHTIQKGPEKFDCVGLAEAAYEAAGLDPTPNEFETGWGWPLTPTEQYEHTVPNF
ncbi:MAG: hypothetical protein NDI60_11490 [Elusimicrobiales bacterium]|nr:hypothetical protein [Elusimicrobiales bacterium]